MPSPNIEPGHYASKQVLCSSRAIRWTHGGRFRTGVELVRRYGGQRLVDYGCGDGTFLQLLLDETPHPPEMLGSEISDGLVADCRTRFAGVPGVVFARTTDLQGAAHTRAYDTIVCMEVLEHVVDPAAVFDHFDTLLAPHGHLIVSVPVETGLPVLIKQSARRVAGWRGIGDYPGVTPYSPGELLCALCATARTRLRRHVFADASGNLFHDHKGFNWLAVREELRRRYTLLETSGSPVRALPPHLNSQAWFVARRR